MRKLTFSATIRGTDLVRKTGPIRVPAEFRIRVYDDEMLVKLAEPCLSGSHTPLIR